MTRSFIWSFTRKADPEDSFDHFEEQRETNVELLRDLTAADGDAHGGAQEGGPDHAFADAARMGAARSGTHPAGRRTGARAQVPGGRRSARGLLQPKAMIHTTDSSRPCRRSLRWTRRPSSRCRTRSSACSTKDANFVHETANFEFAVAAANRIKPAFVVITGDLTNKAGDAAQIAEYHRIAKKLDPKIKLFACRAITTWATSRPPNRWPRIASIRSRLLHASARARSPGSCSIRIWKRARRMFPRRRRRWRPGSGPNWRKAKAAGREAHHRVPAHFVFPEGSGEAGSVLQYSAGRAPAVFEADARIRRAAGLRRPLPSQRTGPRWRSGDGDDAARSACRWAARGAGFGW